MESMWDSRTENEVVAMPLDAMGEVVDRCAMAVGWGRVFFIQLKGEGPEIKWGY